MPRPAKNALEDPVNNPWPAIAKVTDLKLLRQAMERAGLDAWVVICRENYHDHLAIPQPWPLSLGR